jgi:hypothetical protein
MCKKKSPRTGKMIWYKVNRSATYFRKGGHYSEQIPLYTEYQKSLIHKYNDLTYTIKNILTTLPDFCKFVHHDHHDHSDQHDHHDHHDHSDYHDHSEYDEDPIISLLHDFYAQDTGIISKVYKTISERQLMTKEHKNLSTINDQLITYLKEFISLPVTDIIDFFETTPFEFKTLDHSGRNPLQRQREEFPTDHLKHFSNGKASMYLQIHSNIKKKLEEKKEKSWVQRLQFTRSHKNENIQNHDFKSNRI